MRTVRDESGKRYILVKRSSESSLVRDPRDGSQQYVANDRLHAVDGVSPLEAVAGGVSSEVRKLLTGVHDDVGLGLIVDLVDRGPIAVRDMMREYDQCESDLHGRLAELRAADLVKEAHVAGERGYAASEDAKTALAVVREE